MTKNTFVLRTSYGEIFNEMSDKQAGLLIKAIFNYVATGDEPVGFNDVELKMAFRFIKQDIDYDSKKYADLCQKRANAGKAGGRPATTVKKQKKHLVSVKPNGLQKKHVKHNDNDVVVDVVVDNDGESVLTTSTADAAAGLAHLTAEPTPIPNLKPKLNKLQEFSNAVLAEFEEEMNDVQKGIWFKRNCRCLADILNYCGKDIPLALQTVRVCAERLEKAGFTGGYAAVCRNLPEYYQQAKKRLEGVNYANEKR